MQFQRPDRGHDHHRVGLDARLAALDVHELLGAQVGAKAGLGHGIFGKPHGEFGGQHAVAAVGDVGERAAVDQRRVVLQRLHEVRLDGVAQQYGHRAVGLQIGGRDGLSLAGVGYDDPPQPLLQFPQRLGETEDGHHLGGHGDIVAGLAWHGVVRAAQPDDYVPQRPVVHVDHPLPDDPPRIDAQGVAVLDVVIQHRGQEVVGHLDGVEVAGELEIDVLHRRHLGVTAAGGAPLHAEAWAQRRLTEADARPLADPVQGVAQPDAGSGFAFAGGRRRDRRHQHQLADRCAGQATIQVQRHLGLVLAVMLQVLVANAQLGGNLLDRQHLRGAGNLDVGRQRAGRVGHSSGKGRVGKTACRRRPRYRFTTLHGCNRRLETPPTVYLTLRRPVDAH